MKTALYIIFTVVVVLCAGCGSTKEPAKPAIQKENPAPVLRDPFRPDHPTREERDAERRKGTVK